MSEAENLSAPLEDYLETIAELIEDHGSARAGQIAKELSVHKSTVTAALQSLSRKGLVNYAPYQAATLTTDGESRAAEIIRRHESIKRFLTDVLLIADPVAEENACRLEHTLDDEVLARMGQFADFLELSEAGKKVCGDGFARFCGKTSNDGRG
jgi:DtxR family Mn-dependent transcriptional regulator